MSALYRIHVYVEVTDAYHEDNYEWDVVAKRVVSRLRRTAKKPLDKDARLRIQFVKLDVADQLLD